MGENVRRVPTTKISVILRCGWRLLPCGSVVLIHSCTHIVSVFEFGLLKSTFYFLIKIDYLADFELNHT